MDPYMRIIERFAYNFPVFLTGQATLKMMAIPAFLIFVSTCGLLLSVLLMSSAGWYPCKKLKGDPPEVPDGPHVWTVRRNSLFLRFYIWCWKEWPRGRCGYFWKSFLGITVSAMWYLSFVGLVYGVLSYLIWFVVLMVNTLSKIPTVILFSAKAIFVLAVKLPGILYAWTSDSASAAVSNPIEATATAIAFAVLFVAIKNTKAFKFWCLVAKDRINKQCGWIRVVK